MNLLEAMNRKPLLALPQFQFRHISNIFFFLLVTSIVISCSKDSTKEEIIELEQFKDDEGAPPPITQNDISSVDNLIASFLEIHEVPGATIAVSINEKMVYTKGYGLSNIENNTPTMADNLFRVASLSKPVTATAIMTLVDEGKLALSDKVFGPDGILGNDFGSATLTSDELQITVDHLLIHGSGGWSAATGGDPIDYEPQLDSDDFIEYFLNNWDLTNAPGTNFAYSNTGYWMLARIVEKVSEQPYENFVGNMLSSAGISSHKITNFTRADRETNEVEYYGSAQETPWIYSIASRRDGDGGTVISAPDYLRFLCAIDGKSGRADIIRPSSQQLMSEPSNLSNLGRGLGTWQEQNLLFFTGSLPGTRTWFYMNQQNDVTVLLLLNSRRDSEAFEADLNEVVFDLAKDSSIPWQKDLDQF